MLTSTELTINATEFKAKCLDLMDQLARRRLTKITVTKRGKAISIMQPADPSPELVPLFGCMKDMAPAGPIDWDAVEREASNLWPEIDLEALDRKVFEQLQDRK